MFVAEREGLLCIETTKTVRVPKPIFVGKLEAGGAFLTLEYIDLKPPSQSAEGKVTKYYSFWMTVVIVRKAVGITSPSSKLCFIFWLPNQ